jgi:hypothetical protein
LYTPEECKRKEEKAVINYTEMNGENFERKLRDIVQKAAR